MNTTLKLNMMQQNATVRKLVSAGFAMRHILPVIHALGHDFTPLEFCPVHEADHLELYRV